MAGHVETEGVLGPSSLSFSSKANFLPPNCWPTIFCPVKLSLMSQKEGNEPNGGRFKIHFASLAKTCTPGVYVPANDQDA